MTRLGALAGLAGLAATGCALGAAASNAAASNAAASNAAAASGLPSYGLIWSETVGGGKPIALSSPIPATLDGTSAVVVGARNGKVYALKLASGAEVAGWPATTPGSVPVDATPSTGGGLVYVGVGNSANGEEGGYLALRATGARAWYETVKRVPTESVIAGVQASMAYGILQSKEAVTAGSMGQYGDAFVASSGKTLPGFPWFQADSEFSTPSIANVFGNGSDYIVEGGASTKGVGMGETYANGGHIRVLKATGHGSSSNQSVGLSCVFNTNETVDSSPAVGRFLAGNAVGIVVGTGTEYKGVSEIDDVIAVGPRCGKAWIDKLDGATTDSPALVEADSTTSLEVAEGTATSAGTGTVYLLNGTNGKTIWKTNVAGEVLGGITSAALTGTTQDLLVPTTKGLVILDGTNGADLTPTPLGAGKVAMQDSPLVTDDANGDIGVTIAGYNASGGIVEHYEFKGTDGARADEAGAWPMFHDNPQLTGTTLAPIK